MQLIDDVAKAYQDAIQDFYNHGCRYLQIDDTSWTYLIDENFLKKVFSLGLYKITNISTGSKLSRQKLLKENQKDFFIATHFCKGNFQRKSSVSWLL